MTERIDLEEVLLAERRKLAELRALREHVRHNCLEEGDWAVLGAFLSEVIEQAPPGQEWVSLELPEEEVDVEDSTIERSRK